MRSRAARIVFSVLLWIVLAAAAIFLFQSERQITDRRAAFRVFDERAREAARVVADLRASQQAYLAAGQDPDFWIRKASARSAEAAQLVDWLRARATSAAAGTSLMEAAATVTRFGNVDRRVREYLQSDLQLMAGDVVFTEGAETVAEAASRVEAARIAEHQAVDAWEGARRRQQASVASAAAVFAALVVGLIAFGAGTKRASAIRQDDRGAASETVHDEASFPRTAVPALKIAAELCTELGRVNDPADFSAILSRAAEVMDASGLVVWMGNTGGADLRPVLAHGYAPQVLARMPSVTRSADNAVAAAHRTGMLQIVLARPGQSNGALVAPLLTPDGCIGALTAEIRGGGETGDATQALAAIFAAQLASVLASSVVPVAPAADSRIASA